MNQTVNWCLTILLASLATLGCKPPSPPPAAQQGQLQSVPQQGQASPPPVEVEAVQGGTPAASDPFVPFNGMTDLQPGHRIIFWTEPDVGLIAQIVERKANLLYLVRVAGWPADMVEPCHPSQIQSISEEFSVAQMPTAQVQQVEFDRNGTLVRGTVLSRQSGQVKVHLNGYRTNDEVVLAEANVRKAREVDLAPPADLQSRLCIVRDDKKRHWCRAISKRGKVIQVHYLIRQDWSDAWVNEERVQWEDSDSQDQEKFQAARDVLDKKFAPGQAVYVSDGTYGSKGTVVEVGNGKCLVQYSKGNPVWRPIAHIRGYYPPLR
jgi:hypothetical protein